MKIETYKWLLSSCPTDNLRVRFIAAYRLAKASINAIRRAKKIRFWFFKPKLSAFIVYHTERAIYMTELAEAISEIIDARATERLEEVSKHFTKNFGSVAAPWTEGLDNVH